MTAPLRAYRLLTGLAEPLAPELLRRRAARGKEDSARLDERLAQGAVDRPRGRLVWLHGASVGEGLSLLPLAQALRVAAPEAGVLVTSGTVTSATLLGARLPPGVVHRYAPLDLPEVARRFVAAWRPDVAVFAESEVWPNLLAALRSEGVPTALVSARLSRASLEGWGRVPASARAVFGGFDLVLAQDDATAAGFAALGVRDDGRLNLKLAAAAPGVDPAALAALRAVAGGRPVLLAASTHPGEEEVVLDAYAAVAGDARLVIVPRHPERGAGVAALASSRGSATTRQGAGEAFGAAPIHVADALGELGLWYALADSALVGGSLVAGPGGHNPLEPARLGTPALTGPHLDNWSAVFAALGDLTPTVEDAPALARAWAADLTDPASARRRGQAAQARAAAMAGDVDGVATRLLALSQRAP